ncbi:unnamed protein product [Effrenium voratum]|uniref:Uncharacterized protein n=1 Tax=Effrenium voratum TaxID=2562239 RepID=A0AA36HLB2_9DINO|nr:unnamed protein product [Effrenium voratum]
MDAAVRSAHRDLYRAPNQRCSSTRRSAASHATGRTLMSSGSAVLSVRKPTLRDLEMQQENAALAKRLMSVKSTFDPQKDLEEYRRHQRMVQVRQDICSVTSRRAHPRQWDEFSDGTRE